MRPAVILFDIDGTLISADRAGRRALQQAFQFRQLDPTVLDFRFDGLTDPLILERALGALGYRGQELLDEGRVVLEHYLAVLEREVREAPGYCVHPGVHQLVGWLEKQTTIALGLGTGNVRRGAYIKLERGGLSDHFQFGGFGSDHRDRPDILAKGRERGVKRLEATLGEVDTVVIGDTPNDILAARAIGAHSLAVATGGYLLEELLQHEPGLGVANLEDPRVTDWLSSL